MSAQFGDDFADDIRDTENARNEESIGDIGATAGGPRKSPAANAKEDAEDAGITAQSEAAQDTSAIESPGADAEIAADIPQRAKEPESAESGEPDVDAQASVPASGVGAASSAPALNSGQAERLDEKENWNIDLEALDFSDPAFAQRQGEFNQRMLETMRYQMLLVAVLDDPERASNLVKTLDKRAREKGVDAHELLSDMTSAENVTATIVELYPDITHRMMLDINSRENEVRDAFSSAGVNASFQDIRRFCVVAAYQDRFPPANGMSFKEQVQKLSGPMIKALGNPNVQVAMGTIAVTMATGGVGTAFAAAGLARSLINHPRMEAANAKLFELVRNAAPAPIANAAKGIHDGSKSALNSNAFSWLSKGRLAAAIVVGIGVVAMGGFDKAPDLLKSVADSISPALDADGINPAMDATGVGAVADAVQAGEAATVSADAVAGVEAAAGAASEAGVVTAESAIMTDVDALIAEAPGDSWAEVASQFSAVNDLVNNAMNSVYDYGLDSGVGLADQPPVADASVQVMFEQSSQGMVYTVSADDSARGLWGIADRYLEAQGVANPTDTQIANMVNDIVYANADQHPDLLANRDLIHPGQTLTMPGGAEAVAEVQTSPLPKVDMSTVAPLPEQAVAHDEVTLAGTPFKKGTAAPSM